MRPPGCASRFSFRTLLPPVPCIRSPFIGHPPSPSTLFPSAGPYLFIRLPPIAHQPFCPLFISRPIVLVTPIFPSAGSYLFIRLPSNRSPALLPSLYQPPHRPRHPHLSIGWLVPLYPSPLQSLTSPSPSALSLSAAPSSPSPPSSHQPAHTPLPVSSPSTAPSFIVHSSIHRPFPHIHPLPIGWPVPLYPSPLQSFTGSSPSTLLSSSVTPIIPVTPIFPSTGPYLFIRLLSIDLSTSPAGPSNIRPFSTGCPHFYCPLPFPVHAPFPGAALRPHPDRSPNVSRFPFRNPFPRPPLPRRSPVPRVPLPCRVTRSRTLSAATGTIPPSRSLPDEKKPPAETGRNAFS